MKKCFLISQNETRLKVFARFPILCFNNKDHLNRQSNLDIIVSKERPINYHYHHNTRAVLSVLSLVK